jgi:hypothetical protein
MHVKLAIIGLIGYQRGLSSEELYPMVQYHEEVNPSSLLRTA